MVEVAFHNPALSGHTGKITREQTERLNKFGQLLNGRSKNSNKTKTSWVIKGTRTDFERLLPEIRKRTALFLGLFFR